MFAIHVETNFYAGTLNVRGPHLMDDLNGRLFLFAAREDAETFARLLAPRGTYVLAHGQYARPTYEVRDYSGRAGDELRSLHQACLAEALAYDETGPITAPARFREWLAEQED